MPDLFQSFGDAIYRRMGYYTDQQGILRRYNREKAAWDEHLQKTRQFIIDQAKGKNKGKVAVLGSGWLLDVPWKELSEQFAGITLFDIRHPAKIKKLVSECPNVLCVEADISGFAKPFYRLLRSGKISEDTINRLQPEYDFSLEGFDYIVSCNILNQLDIIILDYIKNKAIINPDTERLIRQKIQSSHIGILIPSKSCLVTDADELWVEKDGNIKGSKELLFAEKENLTLLESWVWKFDNHFSYHPGFYTWFKVKAFAQ